MRMEQKCQTTQSLSYTLLVSYVEQQAFHLAGVVIGLFAARHTTRLGFASIHGCRHCRNRSVHAVCEIDVTTLQSQRQSRSRVFTWAYACLIWLPFTFTTSAHQLGESYVFLEIHTNGLSGRVEVLLDDLKRVLDLDQNSDGKITEVEVTPRESDIRSYLAERFQIGSIQAPYQIELGTNTILDTRLGRYFDLRFEAQDTGPIPDRLQFKYTGFFEDSLHRGFLIVEWNELTQVRNTTEAISLIFSPEASNHVLDITTSSRLHRFIQFAGNGLWVVWSTPVHALFLTLLYLPSVVRWKHSQLEPVQRTSDAVFYALKTSVLFALGHSLTLALAAKHGPWLPSLVLTLLLAVSIMAAALSNLSESWAKRVTWIVVGFGLVHGWQFGLSFAQVGPTPANYTLSLWGFHLGVEIGQATIIAALLPILYAIREQPFYARWIIRFGSVALALAVGCHLIGVIVYP